MPWTFQTQARWIILTIPVPEAATWVFISKVLNSGRTHRLYLKLMGLDYGRMKNNEIRTHLCRVWLPSEPLALFPSLLWAVGVATSFPALNIHSVWESFYLQQSAIIIHCNVVFKVIEQGRVLVFNRYHQRQTKRNTSQFFFPQPRTWEYVISWWDIYNCYLNQFNSHPSLFIVAIWNSVS